MRLAKALCGAPGLLVAVFDAAGLSDLELADELELSVAQLRVVSEVPQLVQVT